MLADVDKDKVKALLSRIWQDKGQGFISPQSAAQIMSAYGISVPSSGIATSVAHAISLAEQFSYPVALKLVADGIIHKADVGGLALNLENELDVRQAFQRIVGENPRRRAMIQSMAATGVEVIVGIQRDAQFGPVLMFGAGGTYVEVSQDVSFRLAPLCHLDAMEMIQETVIGQILYGVRGIPPSDVESLQNVLLRVGQLASDFPSIAELDINPLIVNAQDKGCSAVDVRIAIDKMPQ